MRFTQTHSKLNDLKRRLPTNPPNTRRQTHTPPTSVNFALVCSVLWVAPGLLSRPPPTPLQKALLTFHLSPLLSGEKRASLFQTFFSLFVLVSSFCKFLLEVCFQISRKVFCRNAKGCLWLSNVSKQILDRVRKFVKRLKRN